MSRINARNNRAKCCLEIRVAPSRPFTRTNGNEATSAIVLLRVDYACVCVRARARDTALPANGGRNVKDKLSISSADTDKPHSRQQFSYTAPARRVNNFVRARSHLPSK